jgi:multidrug efflux system membrane fusion protein
VVITQIQPISVLFNLPQQQLGLINKAFAKGALTVEVLGPDNKTIIDRGILQVIDNQVDPLTGTIKLKAEFPNPELQLWPGQFVNVRLLIDTLREVIVVPTAAVQRGPSGPFVYVAQPDDIAVVRPVTITQQDETQAVIASGLASAERVITTGFSRLTGGARIMVASAEEAPQPGAGSLPEAARRREGGPRPEGARGEGRRGQRSEANRASTPP